MGTTNTTSGSNTSSLQFNPIAQGMYNQLIQGGGDVLKGYMNNPFGNAAYTMGAAQSQKGAQQAGANNMGALNQNQLAQGLGGQAGAGWLAAQKAMTGRSNQAMSSQANVSNVMAALQRQMAAAGTGLSFSPQLTGQSGNFNQSQTQSGLGTWLPQLLSTGLSAGLGFAGGFGGGGGGASSDAAPSVSSVMRGMPMFANGGQFPGFGGVGAAGGNPMMPSPYQPQ